MDRPEVIRLQDRGWGYLRSGHMLHARPRTQCPAGPHPSLLTYSPSCFSGGLPSPQACPHLGSCLPTPPPSTSPQPASPRSVLCCGSWPPSCNLSLGPRGHPHTSSFLTYPPGPPPQEMSPPPPPPQALLPHLTLSMTSSGTLAHRALRTRLFSSLNILVLNFAASPAHTRSLSCRAVGTGPPGHSVRAAGRLTPQDSHPG